MSKPEIDDLINVVDQIDPTVLTAADKAEIKAWGADKVGFVAVNMDTQKILFATSGAEVVFGYMPDEMVGLDLLALVPDEFKAVHPAHVAGFNASPTPRSMGKRDKPLRGRERDGKTFEVEIGLFPRQFKSLRICLANVVRLAKEV